MQHIVVSLTAISHRMGKLHLTLGSILAQDYRHITIVVHVSINPFLLDEGMPAVPEECRNLQRSDPRLVWKWVPNVGPYRKLLPVLASGLYGDSLIVTADDDTLYPNNWLSNLYYHYAIHRCIVASRGHFMARAGGRFTNYRRWMSAESNENPSLFNLPTGKDGVMFHPRFFSPHVLDYRSALEIARTADDLWFKWHTACNGVPVYIVNKDYKALSFDDTNDGPSLYKVYNENGGNDRTVAELETYAAKTLQFQHATL